jgi:phosphate transport system substrate-binding protein
LLPRFGFQTSEGTLSLAAEEAQPPPDRRPDRSPLAVAALIGTSDAYLSPADGEVALGNSAGNYVLPAASAIQAGLASFTNTPANETISLINGSGAGVYPIINYEYAIVSTSQASPTRAQDLRTFLNWAVSTGTTQLAQVNFQPLPPSVVTLSQAQIAKIKG